MLKPSTQRFLHKCIYILMIFQRNLNVYSAFQDVKAEVFIANINHKHFAPVFSYRFRDRSLFTEGLVPKRNGLGERNFLT